MNETEMKRRTKVFALRVMKLASMLSKDFVGRRLGDQLLRAGTSVAANYRAACRARSRADFVNKLSIVEEESDKSALWMELLNEGGIVPARRLEKLLEEANQLTAIIVASVEAKRKIAVGIVFSWGRMDVGQPWPVRFHYSSISPSAPGFGALG